MGFLFFSDCQHNLKSSQPYQRFKRTLARVRSNKEPENKGEVYAGNLETIPYTKRKHFVLFTKSTEIQAGEFRIQEVRRKFKDDILPPEHPESIRVHSIGTKILKAMQRELKLEEDYNRWEILILDQPAVKASSCIGGKITITTGMLDRHPTDTEIATFLAHEIAHVVARHAAEGIKLFGKKLPIYNKPSLILLPVLRRLEIEADYISLHLMAAAGYDPRIVPQVYAKRTKTGSGLCHYLSRTHPSRKKRARLLSRARVMKEAMAIYQKNNGTQRQS
ncbi:hypothetical protein Tsubulata_016144 [Turnera subulata]|uniref:Peptidase M48 domain-containing protein n=1 Tax=Turnera subulata TaxID=218843 RepID=A0A9Q0JG85_9ROSI|nr:hypothetical protein Tsubulata_016144 [Turnera subulata]